MTCFDKVLIANRGEIARRIIRTCHKLGISTVAVYSEADAGAPFVQEAFEAVCIGPGPAKRSYLDIERIIKAVKETNADAIHPGYGFLSENAQFALRCEEENIVFIGPSARVIEMMGSKIEARKQMEKAGVPVVPGSSGGLSSLDEAKEQAKKIGFPLMLKASAGGGGIGMQLVHNQEELEKVFQTTIQRAQSFFNDGAVFLEKWISNPRHIEVQIAADGFGNVIHLFERECSVQRRNQKVIEESPSPFLDSALRSKVIDAAIRGAKQIGYTNVGTMEFIFNEDKEFYFLEMNTRLQVEHAVTEAITGIDLVEWQCQISYGEQLPLRQKDIQMNGHAIESRLYAEDPDTFLPSPGNIQQLKLPKNDARFDLGVVQGSVVSPFYDPMIGKIIVHGGNRAEAIEKMEQTLQETKIEGLKTNLALLQRIMKNEDFRCGDYTTKLIENSK